MVSVHCEGRVGELKIYEVDGYYWDHHPDRRGRLLVLSLRLMTSADRVFCRFYFPDSPTNAWFLTESERATAIQRLKVRGSQKVHLSPRPY